MKQSFSFGPVTTHLELLKKLSMLFLIILLTGTLMSKVNGQAIYVDKVDYMPGDEVASIAMPGGPAKWFQLF
jgi:hypothetical protein